MGSGADTVGKANDRQVAGDHYQSSNGIQHWDMVIEHDMDYFQGQITKYVMRWKKKNGIQDLEKAQHFLEKYIESIRSGKLKDPSALNKYRSNMASAHLASTI